MKKKFSLKSLVELKVKIVFFLLASYLVMQAPQIHELWLRHKVGKVSYKVRDSDKSGGGTGFAVKAPSGISYILTNDHVCEVSSDGRSVLIQSDDGSSLRRNIIARSQYTDLCLIEGMPGVEGLSLGDEPSAGQHVAVVGHPSLMPITVSHGTVLGREDIAIVIGIIVDDPNIPPGGVNTEIGQFLNKESCSKPKNLIVEERGFFGPTRLCIIVTKSAYRTNILIQPGNSGSPMVNFWGNVIGVVFASDRFAWGIAVSHKDVSDFLRSY